MKKWLIAVSVSWLLSGCTVQPHTLTIAPELDLAAVQGISIPIKVDVVDQREQPELLGYRNAKNEGEIRFNESLADVLKTKVIEALKQQGANVGKSPEPATELLIEIRKLSYTTPDASWVSHIDLKGEVALVIKRGATTLRKTFTAEQSQDVITAPTEEFNQDYVNLLLTTLLNKALNDREVTGFIR